VFFFEKKNQKNFCLFRVASVLSTGGGASGDSTRRLFPLRPASGLRSFFLKHVILIRVLV
jgi:hypothetical protein